MLKLFKESASPKIDNRRVHTSFASNLVFRKPGYDRFCTIKVTQYKRKPKINSNKLEAFFAKLNINSWSGTKIILKIMSQLK